MKNKEQNNSKSNVELLFENANAGFNAFEEKMLGMSKQQIFNEAYQINAKNEIHGFLCDCAVDELGHAELEVLVKLGEAVIDELYAYYLGVDNASIMFYADIAEWVRDYCEEARKNDYQ